ncbi:MAG: nitric oxide reductase activation protein [Burkholderiaceae bacterium]
MPGGAASVDDDSTRHPERYSERDPHRDWKSFNAFRAPLAAWLRVMWNVSVPLLHLRADDGDAAAPFVGVEGVHLPSAPAEVGCADASRWYSAAAAHAAAHIVFSRRVFVREGTAPITQALLGLLEDARVESLACRDLPGLRRLWAAMHTVRPEDGDDFETLMRRLARALLDPSYVDAHPWVCKGRARFYLDGDGGQVLAQPRPAALRTLASALGHDIGQMRMAFNPRSYRPGPSYRDDNRWLWQDGGAEQAEQAGRPQVAAHAQAARTAPTRAADARAPAPGVWRHAEWDHVIGRLRPDWCTVHERTPVAGDASRLADATPGASLQRELVAVLRNVAIPSREAFRREYEGDAIEVDRAIRAVLSLQSGHADDERVYRRPLRVPERVAALLLVDCSASSANPHGPSGSTQLAVQQRAASLLAGAMSAAGWSFAIQGFDSDGRHGVNHWRVKDFGEPWTDAAASRLAGLRSGLSTRLGAALRQATRALTAERATHRFVIAMTDGDPHDIDVHDLRYLAEDARQAAQAARWVGVQCTGLLLDDAGIDSARRIFGSAGCASLRDVASLPRVLRRLLSRTPLPASRG